MSGALPKNNTLIMTKILDFLYTILQLITNSKAYFWLNSTDQNPVSDLP